ncbi:MAG: MauE/DoxX family redox-associated membrane protein [Sphingobium sp.]
MTLLLAVLLRAGMIGAGLIFLTAGAQKWRHRDVLPGVIANYGLLPNRTVLFVATVLPVLECGVGIALLLGLSPFSQLLGGGLMLVFAAAMAINLSRGRKEIHCGCGRLDLRQHLRWSAVARNLVIAALLFGSLTGLAVENTMGFAAAVFAGIALWTGHMLAEMIGALHMAAVPLRRRH